MRHTSPDLYLASFNSFSLSSAFVLHLAHVGSLDNVKYMLRYVAFYFYQLNSSVRHQRPDTLRKHKLEALPTHNRVVAPCCILVGTYCHCSFWLLNAQSEGMQG